MSSKKGKSSLLELGSIMLFGFALILLVMSAYQLPDWQEVSSERYASASVKHPLGTNAIGQDVAARALQASWSSLYTGIVVSLLSGGLGVLMGLFAGWYSGRWPDSIILWLTGVMEAIPFYLFVAAIAFAFQKLSWSMELAMIATFWTTMTRLIRGEVIRLQQRDYVLSARAIGLPPVRILKTHILPNLLPLLLVQLSLIFISAIKAEVILSFLGLGDSSGISWGMMIAESTQEVIGGYYWNFISASVLLFMLIFSVSLITDKLQSRADPRQGVA